MNALIRKFRVASTTGVVMSLAMAGVLAMAPMSNAMAKSQKGKEVKIEVKDRNHYTAWGLYLRQFNNACKSGKSDLKPGTHSQKYIGGKWVIKETRLCK